MPQPARCPGTLPRRGFLQMGGSILSGLTLTELLRRQAQATSGGEPAQSGDKALIVLWLWGGASHMETFDLKPDAPVEVRGPLQAISTALPGVQIGECLPETAKRLDHVAVVRSMTSPTK